MKIIIRRTNSTAYVHATYDVIDAATKKIIGTATGTKEEATWGTTYSASYHYTPTGETSPVLHANRLTQLRVKITEYHK